MMNQSNSCNSLGMTIDVSIVEALREAKKYFFDHLVEISKERDIELLGELRQDAIFQIAEFFYLLRVCEVTTPDALRRYLDLHNLQMAALALDGERLRRMGLRRERVEKAVFTDSGINSAALHFGEIHPTFDQSSLARLLVEVMSAETCRKAVIAIHRAGLFHRHDIGQVLVTSTGQLETIYAEHVRRLRQQIGNLLAGGGA